MTQALQEFKNKHGEAPTDALAIIDNLKAFVVDTAEKSDYMYQVAKEASKRIKAIEQERKAIADPQHAAWKATNDFFRKFKSPWEQVDRVARDKVKAYVQEQDRLKREAERRAEEARQAAVAAAQAQAAAATPTEVVQATQELQEAQVVSRQAMIEATQEVQGMGAGHRRSNWKAQVDDMKALVLFVAAEVSAGSDGFLEMLLPNQKFLDGYAKQLKTEQEICPGVKAFNDFSVV